MDVIDSNKFSPEEITDLRAEVARAVRFFDQYHHNKIVYQYPNAQRLRDLLTVIEGRELHPKTLPNPLAFQLWLVFGSFFGDSHAVTFTAHRDERLQIIGRVVMAADFLTGESMKRANDYYLLLEIVARKRGFRCR